MQHPFAASFVALALGLLACAADPEVQVSTTPTYTACSPITGTCVPGLECRGGLCLPPLSPDGRVTPREDTSVAAPEDVASQDTATAEDDVGTTPADDVAEVPGDEGATATDVPTSGPDLAETPDVVVTPDQGAAPQPDECIYPGNPSTCPLSDTPGVFIYCRFEPTTANLACQTSPQFAFQFGSACATNTDCDVSLGCHFNVCTVYCELGLSACPAEHTCAPIGHPKWGACQPLS